MTVSNAVLKDTSANQQKSVGKRPSQPYSPSITMHVKTQSAPRKPLVARRLSLGRTSAVSALQPVCISSKLAPPVVRPYDPKIRVTNPRRLKNLWDEVMSSTRDTVSTSNKQRLMGGNKGSSSTSRSAKSSNTTPTARTIYAKPTDSDYQATILASRGISIDEIQPSQSAFAHFGTEEPTGEHIPYYEALPKGSGTSVWLDVAEDFADDVVREYDYMSVCSLCEAEFATYAKETLLKRDARSLKDDATRPWMTERMVELTTRTDAALKWAEPPLISNDIQSKAYRYDIRPDCSYWLSLQAINPNYKDLVSEWVYVMKERITCPYFTVEFKKDESTLEAVINQVATASALALYNRHQLKHTRLAVCGKPWRERDVESLRHYALTFTGHSYMFWCMRPKVDPSGKHGWVGCVMVRVRRGNCSRVSGVQNFVSWVNEIHRWGLTVHGPACEKDIKYCIERKSPGIRTSLGLEELTINSDDGGDADAVGPKVVEDNSLLAE